VLSEGKPAQKHKHKGFKFDLLVLTSNMTLRGLKNQTNTRITDWIPAYGKFSDADRYFWEMETPLTEVTP
jgi:hypothetical protein